VHFGCTGVDDLNNLGGVYGLAAHVSIQNLAFFWLHTCRAKMQKWVVYIKFLQLEAKK